MKKNYFILSAILFLSCPAFSQFRAKFITENPPAGPWNYYAEKIKACSDGGLILVKAAADTATPGNLYRLIKTDSLFNLQWARDINNIPSTAVIMETGELPGGTGYYVYANDNNGTAGSETEILLATDTYGNITWSKNYTVPFTGLYAPSHIRFFPGGEFLMLISDYSYVGYYIIGPSGSVIKGEGIKSDSAETKAPGFDGWVLDDSMFVLTAKSNNDNYACMLSRTGNTRWANRYVYPGTYHQPRAVRRTADGNILVAGLYQDSATSSGGGFLLKLDDTTGNVLWRKVYASSLFSSIGFDFIYERANGNVIVKDIYNTILMETDMNGQVLNARIVDANNITMDISTPAFVASANKYESSSGTYMPSFHKNNEDMNNECLYINYNGLYMSEPSYTPQIIPCIYRFPLGNTAADAGIATAASAYSYTLTDACTGVGIAENAAEPDFTLAPNPASDQVRIRMLNNGEDAVLSIYDISGKMVLQQPVMRGLPEATLSIRGLQPGLYFLYLQCGNKIPSVKKLFVEH